MDEMNTRTRLIAILVAAILVAAAGFTVTRAGSDNKIYPRSGWTLVFGYFVVEPDGRKTQTATFTRFNGEDGRWTEIQNYFLSDGRTLTKREASDERGTFVVGENEIQPIGASVVSTGIDVSSYRSFAGLRNSLQYIGESQVAGFRTITRRIPTGGDEYWTHDYSPEVGVTAIRLAMYTADNNLAEELVLLWAQRGQPAEWVFKTPTAVDYKLLDERINDLNRKGRDTSVLNSLRRESKPSKD